MFGFSSFLSQLKPVRLPIVLIILLLHYNVDHCYENPVPVLLKVYAARDNCQAVVVYVLSLGLFLLSCR